jgi:uncharacterized surface protein with fasciclin (FAS1) repeats
MKPNLHNITLSVLLLVALFLSTGAVTAQDAAVQPQQRTTLMQYLIQERPVLAELLTTAGMAPTLSGEASYTLLAPPEESLKSMKGESAETIRATLALHILKGRYSEADFKDGARVETYGGGGVKVCRKKDQTLLNGVKIVAGNTEVRNGVVHELTGMLIP